MTHYDWVQRMVKRKGNAKEYVEVERKRCKVCRSVRRVLPNDICSYKHYEKDVIDGVINGYITPETLGFEDYPCEMTMKRWKKSTDFVFTKQ